MDGWAIVTINKKRKQWQMRESQPIAFVIPTISCASGDRARGDSTLIINATAPITNAVAKRSLITGGKRTVFTKLLQRFPPHGSFYDHSPNVSETKSGTDFQKTQNQVSFHSHTKSNHEQKQSKKKQRTTENSIPKFISVLKALNDQKQHQRRVYS